MQYIVTAYDGKDEGALERRMAVRSQHMELVEKMLKECRDLCGAAILDDDGKMIGSMLVVDFPTREGLDEWLKIEPYVVGKVWEQIEIKPCKVAPAFMELYK